MSELTDRVAALEARMAEVTARLTDLATRLEPTTAAAPSPVTAQAPEATPRTGGAAAPADAADTAASGDRFWALAGLRRRLPDPAGAVLYTGVVEAVPGERYEWQYGATTAGLLAESEWAAPAGALAALAHPVRLLLLREILSGRRRAADLAEVEGLGTSGQLYHHLRQLSAAGWLRSTGRGQYAVPAERVVPLLVILTAARH